MGSFNEDHRSVMPPVVWAMHMWHGHGEMGTLITGSLQEMDSGPD